VEVAGGGYATEAAINAITAIFSILAFLIIFQEMNLAKKILDLTLLSHTSAHRMTHEGVTPYALSRLRRLAHARRATLAGAVTRQSSHAMSVGATHASIAPYRSA
jgi:hypothetical protein